MPLFKILKEIITIMSFHRKSIWQQLKKPNITTKIVNGLFTDFIKSSGLESSSNAVSNIAELEQGTKLDKFSHVDKSIARIIIFKNLDDLNILSNLKTTIF